MVHAVVHLPPLRKANDPTIMQRIRREIKVWLDLRHKNVFPLVGKTLGSGRFPAMVCPWIENGSLTSYMEGYHAILPVVDILALVRVLVTSRDGIFSAPP